MKQNPPSFRNIIDKNEIAEIFGISSDEIYDDYPVKWVSIGLESVIFLLQIGKA